MQESPSASLGQSSWARIPTLVLCLCCPVWVAVLSSAYPPSKSPTRRLAYSVAVAEAAAPLTEYQHSTISHGAHKCPHSMKANALSMSMILPARLCQCIQLWWACNVQYLGPFQQHTKQDIPARCVSVLNDNFHRPWRHRDIGGRDGTVNGWSWVWIMIGTWSETRSWMYSERRGTEQKKSMECQNLPWRHWCKLQGTAINGLIQMRYAQLRG
jgi:hypothetical protein